MKVVALLLVGVPIWFDYASAAPCTIQSLRSAHPEICKPPPSEAPRSEAKMRSLFTEVQQIMREFILQGRPSSELSSEERSLLNRISSIEFKGFHPCSGLAVATYHRDEHKVSMCSSLRSFPVAALVGMMAHEMGHAPDSCSVQCPLLHAPDRSRVRLPRDLDQDSRRQFDQTMRQSTRPIHFSPWELMDRREVIDQWRAQGVVEVVGQAMPLSRYPSNRIRMRLVNQEGLFSGITTDSLARNRIDSPGCDALSDYETLADVWGALVLGQYFKNHPELKGKAARRMFATRRNEICSTKDYNSVLEGINSVWLAAPGVPEALGCEPHPDHQCLRSQPPFPVPANAIASPGSPTVTR